MCVCGWGGVTVMCVCGWGGVTVMCVCGWGGVTVMCVCVWVCVWGGFDSVFSSHLRYHLRDIVVGKIYFLLVRIKIKHMEIAIIKKETSGSRE